MPRLLLGQLLTVQLDQMNMLLKVVKYGGCRYCALYWTTSVCSNMTCSASNGDARVNIMYKRITDSNIIKEEV